jgi:hypothetical protein
LTDMGALGMVHKPGQNHYSVINKGT